MFVSIPFPSYGIYKVSKKAFKQIKYAGVKITAIAFVLSSCTRSLYEFQPNVSYGGRIVAMDKDPFNNSKVVAAAASGGIFLSSNTGKTWSHVDMPVPVFEMADVKFCPTNSNIVIVTSYRDLKVNNGGGIWRSTDGGKTWLKPATSVYVKDSVPQASHGYGISFEPGQSSKVYVGTEWGVAISNDNGATWSYNRIISYLQVKVYDVLAGKNGAAIAATSQGIYKTTNGGINWNYVAYINASSTRSLCYSTLNNNNVFLAGDGYQIFYSGNFGNTWKQITAPFVPRVNREPFIRFTSQPSNVLGAHVNISYLYYGNGTDLLRKILPNADVNDGSIFFNNDWVKLTTDHLDPSDVIFSNDGTSLLLSCDGGIQNTTDGGSTWHLTGGGSSGLNALQINEATAQENDENGKKDYIYFGTQDNQLWASLDGGGTWSAYGNEGHSIQTKRRAILSQGNLMTFALDDSVSQYSCQQGYANVADWNEVLSRAGDPVSVPEGDLLDPNPRDRFIQVTFSKGVITPRFISFDRYYFRNTLNGGGTWNTIGEMTYAPTAQYPKISNNGEPTIYQPYFTGVTTKNGFDKIGLVKLSQTNRTTLGLLENADANGFGSLGIFTTEFKWYNVFAVNPTNPDNVMIADIEDSAIGITYDGGKNWYPNYRLTSLITNHGAINFYQTIDCCPKILVTCINYDPDDPNQIAIGTRENGIFYTWDGGKIWYKLDNTTQITNASSIFFYFDGTIMVSTYGRGLWKFKPVRSNTSTSLLNFAYETPEVIDMVKGKITQLGDLTKQGIGKSDSLLAVNPDSTLTLLQILTKAITSLRGLPVALDTLHSPREAIQLALPPINVLKNIFAKLLTDDALKAPVRYFIFNDSNLVTGLVVSERPYIFYKPGALVTKDNRSPYIHVLNDSMNAITEVILDKPFYVKGVNFHPSGDDVSKSVQVYLDGNLYKDSVAVDTSGSFLLPVTLTPSNRKGLVIKVVQKNSNTSVVKTIAIQREFENIAEPNEQAGKKSDG